MARRMAFAAALAAWAMAGGGEPEWKWPAEVVYNRQVRNVAWLEAVYTAQSPRIVMAGGFFWHLDAPQRQEFSTGQHPPHVLAKAAKLLDGGLVLCDLASGGTALAKLPDDLTVKPGAVVLLIAFSSPQKPKTDNRERAPDWLCLPAEPRPITRAQFLEAIRAGLQLYFVEECPECHGKGVIEHPGVRRADGTVLRKPTSHPCDRCKGTGRVPVSNITR